MNCSKTRQSLPDFLDGRSDEETTRAVADHLEECAACRSELADHKRLQRMLAALGDAPVADDAADVFWTRLSGRLDEPERASQPAILVPRRRGGQPRWLVPTFVVGGVIGIAAVVLAMALVVQAGQKNRREREARAQEERSTLAKAMSDGALRGVAKAPAAMAGMRDGAAGTRGASAETGGDVDRSAGRRAGSDAMRGGDSGDRKAGGDRAHRRARSRRSGSSRAGASSMSSRSKLLSSSGSSSSGSSSSGSSSSGSSSAGSSSSGSSSSGSIAGLLGSSASKSSSGDAAPPSNMAISAAFRRLYGLARACSPDPATLRLSVTVRGETGRVSRVRVHAPHAGTRAATCIGQVVRRAQFPRSGRSSYRARHVFRLR